MRNSEELMAPAHAELAAARARVAALEALVARQRAALNAARVGLWDWDLTTGQVTRSDDADALFGLAPGELAHSHEGFLDRVHPDDRADIQAAMLSAIAGRAEYSVEFRTLSPDGESRWLMGRGEVIRDAAGTPQRVAGVVLDISERKAVESARRASEQRFRAMVEHAFDAIILFAADSTILYASPSSEHLSGRAPEEVVGRSVLANLDPADLGDAQRLLQALLARPRQRVNFRTRMRHADGTWRWIDVTAANYLDDPAVGAIVCNYHDITERHQAETALRESEARFRALVDHAPEGIFVYDVDAARFVDSNPYAERLFGLSRDALLRQTLVSLSAAEQPDGRAAGTVVAEALKRALAGETPLLEQGFVGADGREIVCEVHLALLPASDRRLIRASLTDITERKHLEAQLRQAQRMEAVGQLAGGVAHDFNNLLTVINGFSHLLAGELAPQDPHREYVQEIALAGERAAALTQQLLAFSRRQMLQPRVLDLNAVLLDLQPMLRRLIEEHIDLRFALTDTLGAIKVDAGQLQQVVVNLVVNARDAMPRGGILTIETSNVELDADAARDDDSLRPGAYVMLAVSDTGCGMDAATRARIFEPFFTTKEVGQGTGLGLSTVYGIVKQSQGFVWVYSEPGQGSTFKVYLPREQTERPDEPPHGTARGGRGEAVLLVDDAAGPRLLARQTLRERGYRVIEASNAEEALAASQSHIGPLDLLLTDLVLPGMNGHALAERLRRERPGLRVLYTSGYTEHTLAQHGVPDPTVTLLTKPYTPSALAHAVRAMLDGVPIA